VCSQIENKTTTKKQQQQKKKEQKHTVHARLTKDRVELHLPLFIAHYR
jgi:hypothetical protein